MNFLMSKKILVLATKIPGAGFFGATECLLGIVIKKL